MLSISATLKKHQLDDIGDLEHWLQASRLLLIESRQGFKIACLEEVAYRKGFIDAAQFQKLGEGLNNAYGRYILEILAAG